MRRALVTFSEGAWVLAELADDDASRQRGLAGRLHLPRDAGMLFRFADAGPHDFTVAEMHFPIDLIAVRRGRVERIVDGVVPAFGTFPVLGALVLEVGAGWCRQRGVRVGQAVDVRSI